MTKTSQDQDHKTVLLLYSKQKRKEAYVSVVVGTIDNVHNMTTPNKKQHEKFHINLNTTMQPKLHY